METELYTRAQGSLRIFLRFGNPHHYRLLPTPYSLCYNAIGMDEDQINLLEDTSETVHSKGRRPFFLFRRFTLSIIALTLIAGIVFSFTSNGDEDGTGHPSFFGTVRGLVVSADKELKGEEGDRVNFLILGIGGAGHDGPELTDTIILASVRPSTKEVGMLSIPRDLSVPLEGYGWRKVNHVNAYGEEQRNGYGPTLAAKTIGEVFDQPVHYWVKVDFKGFEEFIDAIGGVDIDVERTFTDPAYPIDDGEGTVIALEFAQGITHMDGETALRFVRSRHGNNNEGSDFARAARQQKVILAVKRKLLSPTTLLNPARIARLIDTFNDNIRTNMSTWEMIRFANLGNIFDSDEIGNVVLTTAPGSPLYETTVNGAYVILPRGNDWTPLQTIAENIFTADDEIIQLPDAAPRGIRIELQNGTDISGLATQAAALLALQGYEVGDVGNATVTNQERTLIYDLTDGAHKMELIALSDFLAADISLSAPGWLLSEGIVPDHLTLTNDSAKETALGEGVDFLIILGHSSVKVIR